MCSVKEVKKRGRVWRRRWWLRLDWSGEHEVGECDQGPGQPKEKNRREVQARRGGKAGEQEVRHLASSQTV